ncbi:hypothetical protein C8F01DRAFT_1124224 [Mycena amicta]|nr:hypothetical protein C8F01DRAFT_1124224 [Mycena amicta]
MTPTTRLRAKQAREDDEKDFSKPNDDAWEDVEPEVDEEKAIPRPSARGSPKGTLARNSPRKRIRTKTVYVAAPGLLSPKKIAREPSKAKLPLEPRAVTLFVIIYLFDVLKTAVNLLRRPLSFCLFLWMLAFVLQRISNTMRAAFAPICWLPLVSQSAFCLPASTQQQKPQWADFPRLVDVQSATLEQLLDESASGSTLALQIKKAEMATADLVTLVRVSDLQSRDMLGDALRTFVDDARTASRSLNKLNAKVSGAVDGVFAVNDYALKTIEGAHSQASPSIIKRMLPWPYKPKTDIVVSAFEDSMNYLSFTMARLVVEFELNLHNLDKLEEQLSVLHELVSRENTSISSAQSELLADLWTKLGGNRDKLRGYEHHLGLLKGLGEYRKKALAHVVGALHALAQMSEEIENLRERVAAPELVGGRIPLEVHIRSIQGGLERLNEGRSKAKVRESEAAKRALGVEM